MGKETSTNTENEFKKNSEPRKKFVDAIEIGQGDLTYAVKIESIRVDHARSRGRLKKTPVEKI